MTHNEHLADRTVTVKSSQHKLHCQIDKRLLPFGSAVSQEFRYSLTLLIGNLI